MGEASTMVRISVQKFAVSDVGAGAEWVAAVERLEDECQARTILRRHRIAELVAPVPSWEAMRRMGGER